MRSIFLVIGLLTLGCYQYSSVALSQDHETIQFASGIVKAVSGNEMIVTEYDYESDEEIENIYITDQSTEFNGVESLREISADDNVDIVYNVVSGQNIAQSVTIEKPFQEDDGTDSGKDGLTDKTATQTL